MTSVNNLEKAFNLMATHYDSRYTENPSMALMRKRVRQVTLPYLKPDCHILELGSGTGEDAVFLAKNRCNVLATDCSPNMLNIIEQKAVDQKLGSALQTELLDIHDLNSLIPSYESSFDGIFSNFGGLNTVEHLTALNSSVTTLLKPGGWFIACVMGRHCIWDYFLDLCQFKFGEFGKRRSRDGVHIGVGEFKVTCYFPTPNEFISAFPGLECVFAQALGLFLPPPRLTGKLHCLNPLWTGLDLLEQPFSKINSLQGCGDHFLVVLNRRRYSFGGQEVGR